jgi:hypothetical protein
MIESLRPRDDGLCIDCYSTPAETRDKLFCKKCLKVRLDNDYRVTPPPTENKWRTSISTQTIGGAAEMLSSGDEGSDQ